jgi:hypothetical protein
MNEYLTKPLDKKLLLSMVHKCSTTVPVLHPNMNLMMDVTPTAELSDPFDTPVNYQREARTIGHTSSDQPTLQRKTSRSALLRATTSPQ